MRQTVASKTSNKETSNVMALPLISIKKEQQKYDREIANKKKTRKTQLIKSCNETYDRKLFLLVNNEQILRRPRQQRPKAIDLKTFKGHSFRTYESGDLAQIFDNYETDN
mgnify:CR=1 FL=1